MYKKLAFLLTASQMFVCLSGCALRKPADETVVKAAYAIEQEAARSVSIVKGEGIDGRKLQIDVEVTIPDLQTMAKIQLGANTETREQFINDWMLSKHPDVELTSTLYEDKWILEEGEELLECLQVDVEGIHTYYLNVVNDINSDTLDDAMSQFTPHYVTSLKPPLMDITAQEAAQEASAILSQYSCFTYTPWNIVAFDAEVEGESGYYSMNLQPLYNGIPILECYIPGSNEDVYLKTVSISVGMSAEGLFSFQGNLLLKEIGRAEVEQTLFLERAVEKMSEDFQIYAVGETVSVTNIYIAYYLQGSAEDETGTLIPGWVFECRDSAEESGSEQQYACFYDLENGNLRLLQY